jgi:hypothetical protein
MSYIPYIEKKESRENMYFQTFYQTIDIVFTTDYRGKIVNLQGSYVQQKKVNVYQYKGKKLHEIDNFLEFKTENDKLKVIECIRKVLKHNNVERVEFKTIINKKLINNVMVLKCDSIHDRIIGLVMFFKEVN